jgi:hypothetical protein
MKYRILLESDTATGLGGVLEVVTALIDAPY